MNLFGPAHGQRQRVLVACEFSGVVRRAFRALGHEAFSCDLLPAADGSPHHIHGDVLEVLGDGWDIMIAHPDCTFLTCSAEWAYKDGPYHQKLKPDTLAGSKRRDAREVALVFVRRLMDAPIERIAVENPPGVIGTRIRPASQYVHPHQFGHDASKRTGLWLKNLSPLQPTLMVAPRMVGGLPRWANQTDSGQNKLPPSADRWKLRAETYDGIGAAMADQWGGRVDD